MRIAVKSVALVAAGFAVGVLVNHFPQVAAETSTEQDMSQRQFRVSIDEVKQNFVAFDEFSGKYVKTVTMSDGTTRRIELTPMIHNGMQVVEFKDNDGHTYMGLNGTTTNGTLMVQLRERATALAAMRAEGWPQAN